MKKSFIIAAVAAFAAAAACSSGKEDKVFVITDYGAQSGLAHDCTEAINNTIIACSEAGGGIVSVPEGEWLTSTVHLRSDVNLRLEKGSRLVAVQDPEAYHSYIPEHDMSRYDSGEGTVNSNNSRDVRWNRAMVLGTGLRNVSITGGGVIDGGHVFDPLGEEYMRGPHCILLAECDNVTLSGFSVERAANYAVMGYALSNVVADGLHISEGWDGIHIRGGEHVTVKNCRFETGDDAIAGGYWNDMHIVDNYINSSCNGIRMIMPCEGLLVEKCVFEGPGHYPHRTSGELRRCNMLFGIILEPGGWGPAPGDLRNVVLRDLDMTAVSSPLAVNISKDNHAYDLTVENVTALGCTGAVSPFVSWSDMGFDRVSVNAVTVGR